MRTANKSPKMTYSAMVRKWKSDPESASEIGVTPKVNQTGSVLFQ